jgi:uncharacterized protein (DUF305 family)
MKMLRRILFLMLFVFAPLEIAGSATQVAVVVAADPMVKDLAGRQGEDFEAVFLSFLIHHHRAGIRMAGLVAERGMDADLKLEAEKLISINNREIEQMEQWLEQWHPRKPGEDMIPQTTKEKELQAVSELEKVKDAKFDKLFSSLMTEHQETGIQMARLGSTHAVHEEVKGFASRVAELQGELKGSFAK